MIGRLKGTLVSEDAAGAAIVDVQGVGYEVLLPVGAAGRAQQVASTGELILHIHTRLRQDGLDLFGFASERERQVFRLLTNVPSVGAKTALAVLSVLPPDQLAAAVGSKDVRRLSKVPGIGKKTAERLIMELREKLPSTGENTTSSSAAADEKDQTAPLVAALTNMGYKSAEAERAVKALGDRVKSEPLAALLREVLSSLAG